METADLHDCAARRAAFISSFFGCIDDVHDVLAAPETVAETTGRGLYGAALGHPLGELRCTANGNRVVFTTVVEKHVAEVRLAQPHRLFEHCIEDGCQFAGRAVDDPQY